MAERDQVKVALTTGSNGKGKKRNVGQKGIHEAEDNKFTRSNQQISSLDTPASSSSHSDRMIDASVASLHAGALPVAAGCPLPRREKEYSTILNVLVNAIEQKGTGGSLYISGMPGTGTSIPRGLLLPPLELLHMI